MTKIVSATEFKAKCLALIAQMEKDGEPVTITRRGKPVATLTREEEATPRALKPVFGMLKSDRYRDDWDPSEPAVPLEEWEALR